MDREHHDMKATTTMMSSSPKQSPERRRRVDVSQLSSILRNNAPMAVGVEYRDRPVVNVGYVEPALADSAHCVWQEQKGTGGKQHDAKIYLGPALSAGTQAYESLVAAGVGAIINCTPHIPCYHRRTMIQYCQIPVRDHAGADMLTTHYLQEATSFLNGRLRQGMSVLVHCEMGVSRSATVCIAYLMQYHNMTRDQAYIILKQRRPSINPNEGFWQQLLLWQHQHRTAASITTRSYHVTGSTAKIAAAPEPIDRDWAQASSTFYSTCREMEGTDTDLSHACFDRCVTANANDRNHILEVCLDVVWGRGVSAVDVDWLTALCRFLAEKGNNNGNTTDNDHENAISRIASVSVQRQVLAIIEDVDSDFGSQWSGEIYPNQIERIRQALGL
jgi:hypothetical protein